MKTKTFLVSSFLLATTVVQSQEARTLTPNDNNVEDITYNRSFALIEKERQVKYGEPIDIIVNKEEGSVDIFNLDDIIIRIPLEEILSQPNRTGPNNPEK